MTKKQAKEVQNLLNEIDVDISIEDLLDIDDFDELRDFLQDGGFLDEEIIYNSNAMEYLEENDPSLQYSLGIASDMGYTLDKLNSEVLASLLASQNKREDFEDLRKEIEEIIS